MIKGARSDAHDGFGASRVPRSASMRNEILRSGFCCSAVRMVEIFCARLGVGWKGEWSRLVTYEFVLGLADVEGG